MTPEKRKQYLAVKKALRGLREGDRVRLRADSIHALRIGQLFYAGMLGTVWSQINEEIFLPHNILGKSVTWTHLVKWDDIKPDEQNLRYINISDVDLIEEADERNEKKEARAQ